MHVIFFNKMYGFLSYDYFNIQFLKSCVRLRGLCIEIVMSIPQQ